MMELVVGCFIFILVLFLYLHVQFHLKTGDELEVYELKMNSKNRLEEICDLRQPVIMDFEEDTEIMECTRLASLKEQYGAFEIKLRNPDDFDFNSDVYMPVSILKSMKLFHEAPQKYFSENNADFLQETTLAKKFQRNDGTLRPPMVSSCAYDILLGSPGVQTPLRFEINYRNYFYVTQGSVGIKLIPPRSSKYLHQIMDYDLFEFRSPINPWAVQDEWENDFAKVKSLHVTLNAGQLLHIPAYWWYSIEFGKDTSVTVLKYRTYMSTLATSPHLIKHAMQIQNTKAEIAHKWVSNDKNDKNDTKK